MVAFLKYKVTVWTPSMHHPGGPLDLLSRTQHQIARPEKNLNANRNYLGFKARKASGKFMSSYPSVSVENLQKVHACAGNPCVICQTCFMSGFQYINEKQFWIV